MVWKVIEIHLRRLRHNRVEWLLTFIVPIAFFTIFALIFTRGVGSTPRVKVVLVDGTCRPVLDALSQNEGLRIVRGNEDALTVDRPTAETMVRRGTATIAVVIHENEGDLSAELLNDASDQVAAQVVTALVTRAMMTHLSSAANPLDSPNRPTTGIDPDFAKFVENVAQKPAITDDSDDADTPTSPASSAPATPSSSPSTASEGFRPPKIDVVNVIGQGKSNPLVSVYAAGIAVMFLLFGATSGGGVLLEERESHTLERLLATQMSMDQLLLGKWFYLTLLGCVQVTVMFVWAQIAFGLDLMGHFDGFVMMTVTTAAAAASFGLFLATLCRTRGQLNGLSVVAVLTMSALGGSMVPRYVMSESLRDVGLWTFNAWALDGYDKVFWRELPPSELGPQLSVLLGTAFALLILARLLAIRWETN
ncbi:ABC transporter permease [Neorhodopirellula pilleata]|uniref:ABC-2 family transporter protein n=1 Tax=Neorhodopirellula pilleata TaxID=2714738 RepID=A0A5C6AUI8_9BACT|nr:ABC transporter permease [Neorhodopirellula pilleata]TWU01834.1 ABC-2 family transporter protein [Neorhodopirellula pilleata]